MKAHPGFIHRKLTAAGVAISDFFMGLVALVLFLGIFGFGIGAVVMVCMFDLTSAVCCGLIAFMLLGLLQWLQTRR